MVRGKKSCKKFAKSLLWMRKKSKEICQQRKTIKYYEEKQKEHEESLKVYQQRAKKAKQEIVKNEGILRKHKTNVEKQLEIVENCLVKFILNMHPALVETTFTEKIMSFLTSDDLKRMKATNKCMLLHIDATCKCDITRRYRSYNFKTQAWGEKIIDSVLRFIV